MTRRTTKKQDASSENERQRRNSSPVVVLVAVLVDQTETRTLDPARVLYMRLDLRSKTKSDESSKEESSSRASLNFQHPRSFLGCESASPRCPCPLRPPPQPFVTSSECTKVESIPTTSRNGLRKLAKDGSPRLRTSSTLGQPELSPFPPSFTK